MRGCERVNSWHASRRDCAAAPLRRSRRCRRSSPSLRAPRRSRARSPGRCPVPPSRAGRVAAREALERVRRKLRGEARRPRRSRRSRRQSPLPAGGRAGCRRRRSAARCRRGCRAPGGCAADRSPRAGPPAHRRGSRGPARAARSRKALPGALEQFAQLHLLGPDRQLAVRRRGRSAAGPPRAARGGRSPRGRPPATPARCAPLPSARIAASSSAFTTASGVRSSWLASATNCRSRSKDALQPREHLVERLAQPPDLVVRVRQRQALAVPGQRDPLCALAHRLDRPEADRRKQVADAGGEQHRDRPADQERLGQRRERVVAVPQRGAGDDHHGPALRRWPGARGSAPARRPRRPRVRAISGPRAAPARLVRRRAPERGPWSFRPATARWA